MDYGRHRLSDWMLDPQITYLNHGTVGAPPRPVWEEYRRIQDNIEREPAQFQLRELADIEGTGEPPAPHMRVAAARVADHLGCSAENLVFVDNATTGINAVLRSFPFRVGDEILVTSLGYGGVNNAVRYLCDSAGTTMRTIPMPPTGAGPGEFVHAVASAIGAATKMVLVDHITSQSALILPIAEMVAHCHAAGVPVLVDAAHAPGAVDMDIESVGADWYVANLHKWAFAPRSCGVLWAAPEHHRYLHPVTISWGYGNGLAAEFDLLGTRDPSACLVAPFALDLMERWGGPALRAYNHQMVWTAAQNLSSAWGVDFVTPESMIGPMATIRLPDGMGSSKSDADSLRASLLHDDRIEVPVFGDGNGLSLRLSAQIYNDDDDFGRLCEAVLRRRATSPRR